MTKSRSHCLGDPACGTLITGLSNSRATRALSLSRCWPTSRASGIGEVLQVSCGRIPIRLMRKVTCVSSCVSLSVPGLGSRSLWVGCLLGFSRRDHAGGGGASAGKSYQPRAAGDRARSAGSTRSLVARHAVSDAARFRRSRFHLDRAMTLSPGDVETLGYTGLEYAYAGDPVRGIWQAEQSIRLNPYFPPVSAEQIGKACFIGRRYEEALFWLRQTPDRITTNRGWLAAAAACAGRIEEAATHAKLMRATLLQRLGEEDCERLAALSDGFVCLPGFSMRLIWRTTSAVWKWPASHRIHAQRS